MERDAIRLECLKLRHRHDRSPAEIIIDAKVLEQYVAGEDESAVKELKSSPSPQKKKTGNPDILS